MNIKEDVEGRRWLEEGLAQASGDGRKAALFALGNMLYDGRGGPQDFAEAGRLFGLAAAQGHAEAQFTLGNMHRNGEGGPQDLAEARWLLGLAAAQGNARAQTALGLMHNDGEAGPQDFAEARRLLGLAAAQGNADAQATLGGMHYDGEAVPQDFAEARRLLGLAEAQGHAVEQASLGCMYHQGHGGPKDFAEARRLFGLAAAQGDAEAQMMLGNMHCVRDGGTSDQHLAEARRLFGLAAAQGQASVPAALDDLDRVAERRLTKEQAADAANAMMEQLLAEDAEEKKAKGAAQNAKSAKTKKARKKRGESAATSSVGSTDHELEARDAGVEAGVEDTGEAQAVLMTVAPSPATGPIAALPVAPELAPPFVQAGAAAPVPVAVRATGRGRGRGLGGRGLGGRGGQRVQSAAAIATGDDADDGGESQLAPGEIAETLARQAVQSGKSYHELLAQSTQHASKQDWRRAARACREAIALAPDKPVAYAALGAMYLSSRLYVEAAQWFLEAKERYPEGSEGWVAATANAFDLLRQAVCDEAAKPDWWNDEGLKALSAKVVRAAPADAAANRMRAYVLSGRCAAWVAGPRSSAEFNEAGTHFERAAASVRLESLLQRCRPSSLRTRYRPRYLKACSPAHPEASSTPSQTSATESDRWSTSDSFRSDYE